MLSLSLSWLFKLSIKLFNGHLYFFRKLQARQAFAMYLQRVQQRLVHETRYAGDRLCFIINLSKLRHYRIGQSLFFKTRVSTNLSSENLIVTQKILHIEGSHTKGLFTWSGGPRSSGVGFFVFTLWGTQNKRNLPY